MAYSPEEIERLNELAPVQAALTECQWRSVLWAVTRDAIGRKLVESILFSTISTNAEDDGLHKRKRTDAENGASDDVVELPRFAVCQNCEAGYDTTNNQHGDCVYHSGDKEVDDESSVWDDHDEICHGPKSDHEDDNPEGFLWTCCERQGDSEGCHTEAHQPSIESRELAHQWSEKRRQS